MADLGKLIVSLSLNNQAFVKGLKDAYKNLDEFTGKFKSFQRGGFFDIPVIGNLLEDTLGGALGKLKERAGVDGKAAGEAFVDGLIDKLSGTNTAIQKAADERLAKEKDISKVFGEEEKQLKLVLVRMREGEAAAKAIERQGKGYSDWQIKILAQQDALIAKEKEHAKAIEDKRKRDEGRQQNISNAIQALLDEQDKLTMSDEERIRNQLIFNGATENQLKVYDALVIKVNALKKAEEEKKRIADENKKLIEEQAALQKKLADDALAIIEKQKSKQEKLADAQARINHLKEQGLLTDQQADRALMDEARGIFGQAEVREPRFAEAALQGSAEAMSAIARFNAGGEQVHDPAKEQVEILKKQLAEQKRNNALLERFGNLQQGNVEVN